MIYRYFQELIVFTKIWQCINWQMVLFTHTSPRRMFCMFELLQQNLSSHIWFYNNMILLLLAGLGDQCLNNLAIYQMGNRQVQSQILRITAFDRVVSCQTLQIPVSVKSMADEFYCFAPTFDCSTVTPTKISTRQTADTLFNLGDGRKEKTVD